MRDKIIKVVAWRIISILITAGIFFLFTGDIQSSTQITIFLHSILVIAHYIFETIWEKRER